MQPDGIGDLLPFLNDLRKRGIFFRLDHMRPDSIMVSFTLVGARIELDFFEDHIEFSVFKGSEEVETDLGLLEDIMQTHWSDD